MKFKHIAIPTGLWLAALTLAACGGGTKLAGDIGTGGTGAAPPTTVAVGPINGLGSIVVTGVRYDLSKAQVVVPDGDDSGTGLKLGMVVRLEGSVNADGVTGAANRVDMSADVRGPVTAVTVSSSAAQFNAMGVAVQANAGTVFDGVKSDLSDLQVGDNVQAHGLLNNAGVLVATRVQKRSPCSGTACVYKTIGLVQSSSSTQLQLGNGLVVTLNAATQYDGVSAPPPVNAIVRITTTAPPAGLQVTALKVSAASAGASSVSGTALKEGEVEGFVSNLLNGNFTVSGTAVALTASTQFNSPNTAASLANGQRVEVDGTWSGNVLQATKVKIDSGGPSGDGYELFGLISNFVSAANFQVKGQVVDASGTGVQFSGGTVADLANGRSVEVKGQIVAGVLVASSVKFTTSN